MTSVPPGLIAGGTPPLETPVRSRSSRIVRLRLFVTMLARPAVWPAVHRKDLVMTVSLPRPCGILLACGLFLAALGQAMAAPITVYAAASLSESLQACADQYRARTGQTVRIAFAASSTLARQIDAGAQADLFISADTEWMDFLAERQRIQSKTRRDLLGNRLVLIAAREDPVQLTLAPGFPLAERLGHERLAVADPDAVPAGRYARAALSALHVWNGVATRLARADNVRVALQYVARA
jgi:molybdate transport system substrate-binding protein